MTIDHCPRGPRLAFDRPAPQRIAVERSAAIRVLLADGSRLVRAAFRSLLGSEMDIAVAAEATSCDETVALAIRTRPDVVLIDLRLPGLSALEATRRILASRELSGVKVLIVSAEERDEDVLAALRAGASGLLIRDADPVELPRAVRAVAAGGLQFSPAVTRSLIERFTFLPDLHCGTGDPFNELTDREREVVALVAVGLNNQEIAERLVISRATAKSHVSRAMVKLDVRDRARLVALAYETGFVQQPRRRGGHEPPGARAIERQP